MRRAAALFLAELPPLYRDKCARVAAAVDAAVGSPSKLGLNAKFKEIMAEDPCFKLTPRCVEEGTQAHEALIDRVSEPRESSAAEHAGARDAPR